MKKNITLICVAVVLFLILPFLATVILPHDAGKIFGFLMLYIVSPIYFIFNGLYTLPNIKKSWFTPLITVAIFAASFAVTLEMTEPVFSVAYLIICYLTIGIGWICNTFKKKS